jgi:hypothetical protein
MHLQVHAHIGQARGQRQHIVYGNTTSDVCHEVEPHRAKPDPGQAVELGGRNGRRHQGHTEVTPFTRCHGVFHNAVVVTVDDGLNNDAALNTELLVQGKKPLFGCLGRGAAATLRVGEACWWPPHMHMAVTSPCRQTEGWLAGVV